MAAALFSAMAAFPSFPSKSHKQNTHTGKKQLEILAMERENVAFTLSKAGEGHGGRRLAGAGNPIELYVRGPYSWPSLALRDESDAVFESSGVIGWLQYLQMREEEELKEDPSGNEAAWLNEVRRRAREVAVSSLDVPMWGANRSGLFGWYQTIIKRVKEHPLPPAAKCRNFRVGLRGDYQSSIRKAAQSLGMCEWHGAADSGFDLYWGEQWEEVRQFTSARLKPGTLVSTILGFKQSMGDKPALARIFTECLQDALANRTDLQWCEFTKRGFNIGRQGKLLRGQHRQFRQWAKEISAETSFPQLWILKAQKSFNQVGIEMLHLDEEDVKSDAAVLQWMERAVPDGTWTLQEYVMRPTLFDGRKFDMRVWAVISSLDPLRIIINRKFMPKISTKEYSTAVSTKGDACMHFRLPMGPECNKELLPKPYPPHTAQADFYRGLRFAKPLFDSAEAWNRLIVPQVERIISMVVLFAREEPLQLHRELLAGGATFRRFLFLSPDLIVDQWGRVYLEEMNTNGFMPGDDVLYKMQAETASALHVLGADGFPLRPLYERDVMTMWHQFCLGHGEACDNPHALHAALELVDEEIHAFSTSWYRIYPSMLTDAHEKLRQLGDFLTPLDEIISQFLAFRRQITSA